MHIPAGPFWMISVNEFCSRGDPLILPILESSSFPACFSSPSWFAPAVSVVIVEETVGLASVALGSACRSVANSRHPFGESGRFGPHSLVCKMG